MNPKLKRDHSQNARKNESEFNVELSMVQTDELENLLGKLKLETKEDSREYLEEEMGV